MKLTTVVAHTLASPREGTSSIEEEGVVLQAGVVLNQPSGKAEEGHREIPDAASGFLGSCFVDGPADGMLHQFAAVA